MAHTDIWHAVYVGALQLDKGCRWLMSRLRTLKDLNVVHEALEKPEVRALHGNEQHQCHSRSCYARLVWVMYVCAPLDMQQHNLVLGGYAGLAVAKKYPYRPHPRNPGNRSFLSPPARVAYPVNNPLPSHSCYHPPGVLASASGTGRRHGALPACLLVDPRLRPGAAAGHGQGGIRGVRRGVRRPGLPARVQGGQGEGRGAGQGGKARGGGLEAEDRSARRGVQQ